MWKRPAGQTLSETLDISSATAWAAPDLIKAWVVLSDATVERSAVDREDLKPFRKSEWRNFLNKGTTNETFQQSRKQDSFIHTLKSQVLSKKAQSQQFFRITTRIKSGSGTFLIQLSIVLGAQPSMSKKIKNSYSIIFCET